MEFFETKMGREFYCKTMPDIARSLNIIAETMKENQKKEEPENPSVKQKGESKNLFDAIVSSLPTEPFFDDGNRRPYWAYADNEIVCATEEKANALFDLFRAMNSPIEVHTAYCDPIADGVDGDVSLVTGWWSVYTD